MLNKLKFKFQKNLKNMVKKGNSLIKTLEYILE